MKLPHWLRHDWSNWSASIEARDKTLFQVRVCFRCKKIAKRWL